MNGKRLAAGAIAAAVVVGSIGAAAVNGSRLKSEEPEMQTEQLRDEAYTYEYGAVQSLYFKINELWRLSINSDLDAETVNAIATLNNGFDSELLMKALRAEGGAVIDEYIYSVLAGLDFELYLSDKEAYEKEKADSGYAGEILTTEKIDEYLQELNKSEGKKLIVAAYNEAFPKTAEEPAAVEPKTETPDSKSLLPENPAERVKSGLPNALN